MNSDKIIAESFVRKVHKLALDHGLHIWTKPDGAVFVQVLGGECPYPLPFHWYVVPRGYVDESNAEKIDYLE